MKSHTWKPERRNRNIGTAVAGHSQANKMKIPNSWLDRFGNDSRFMERIDPSKVGRYKVNDNDITVLYEKPNEGFSYGCTPDDVIHLFSQLPPEDCAKIDMIIFRQPTRKQARLSSVWGRLIYCAVIGRKIGPAIYIEAQKVGASISWSRKLSLEDQVELDRLRADGHKFTESKRHFTATLTEATIRNTLLYRTLLHEVGQWAQYERDFWNDATALSKDPSVAIDLYFAQPQSQHEDFAHRYAAEMGGKLRKLKVIPFERRG